MKRFEDTYITIQGWMVTVLNLKGLELQAFALVYGFSQDGQSCFSGSLSYITKWLNCSRPTAIATMDKLVCAGWITKQQETTNGQTGNKYRANLDVIAEAVKEFNQGVVKKFNQGSKETLLGGSKISLLGGSKETLPNNTIVINYTNNTIDKESAPAKNEQDLFAFDAHEKTAAHIIAWLDSNPHMIPQQMQGKDWRTAVKGHCLGIKKKEQEAQLLIPTSDGEHYKWIGRRIAGALSWHQVAEKFDKQNQKTRKDGKADNGLLISDEGIAEVFARVRASGLGGY